MAAKRARTELYDPGKHRGQAEPKRGKRPNNAEAPESSAVPILTQEWFRQATWMPRVTKQGVFLRLDPEVVAWFKARGPGYQTRMNAVLRAYAMAHHQPVGKKKVKRTEQSEE